MNGSGRRCYAGVLTSLASAGDVGIRRPAAYTSSDAPKAPMRRTEGRKAMFGTKTRRRNTHYREAMRQLQPFATETSALWLSGYYRGVQALVPGMGLRPAPVRQPRD
jgi:hypothetical protein